MMRFVQGFTSTSVAAVLTVVGLAPAAAAQQGPTYDEPATREIVEQFVEAHGGMAPWDTRGEAASYTHTMYTPTLYAEDDTHWWISHEVVEYDPAGRLYHEWPIDNAKLAFDGEETWWVNWQRPNSAVGMRRVHFGFVFMPWLTQQNNVTLARIDGDVLPDDDVESIVVTMTYEGRPNPAFTIYIDPDTHRMRGFIKGGAVHTIHRLGEYDGALVAMDWTTWAGGSVIGHHSITQLDLDASIDPEWLVRPEGAEFRAAGS